MALRPHIVLLVLSFLSSFPLTQASTPALDHSENRYEEVLQLLKTGALSHEDTQAASLSSTAVGDTSFGTLTLSRQSLLETALHIMSCNDAHTTIPSNVAFTQYGWQSLNLITGNPAIIDSLGTHSTIFGRLYLSKLITSPTTDIERIKKRQNLIAQIQLARSLREQLKEQLNKIANLQTHLLSLSHEDHPIYHDDIRLYHHQWLLRKIRVHGRDTENVAKLLGDIWFSVGPVSAFGAMIYTICKKLFELNAGTEEQAASVLARLSTSKKWANTLMIAAGSYTAFQLYRALYWGYRRLQAMHYLYCQLKPLHEFFQALKEIRYLTKSLTALHQLPDEFDTAIIDDDDPDLAYLRHLVSGAGFSNPASAQLLGGDIVIASDLLQQCRTKLFKGVALVGAVDAYIALADWYEKGQKQGSAPVCLAQFVQRDDPYVMVNDIWHPSLPSEKVVTNSVTLGGDGHTKNIIVTGLFESGKSILLNSIALNVLLSQTTGLCSARAFCGTPFSMINIYAKLKDDLAAGSSLFNTELRRVLELLDSIKALPERTFSFSIADTTFSGTEAGAGQAAAYAVARYLGELDNSILVSATNFISLSLLAEQKPENFTNYHLPTIQNGKVEHSYQLTPGIQQPHLATSIFREEKLPEEMILVMEQELALHHNINPISAEGSSS